MALRVLHLACVVLCCGILTASNAVRPVNVSVRWIDQTFAVLEWSQESNANYVCIDKVTSANRYVFMGCSASTAGDHSQTIPAGDHNDAAYFPDEGDRYYIAEHQLDSHGFYGRYGPFVLGPKPRLLYLTPILR